MGLFDNVNNEFNKIHVEFSDYNNKIIYEQIREFRDNIREENKTIDDINEQIIITNPYYFTKIDKCLYNFAAEINGGKVKDCKFILALFTGWDMSVLNIESAEQIAGMFDTIQK